MTAGALVADEAKAQQTGPVAVAADEGQIRVSCCSFTVLSPASFLLDVGLTGIFKGGNGLVHGVMPALEIGTFI